MPFSLNRPPLAAVADVLALLDARVHPLPMERVPLAHAAGRVLAEAIVSTVNVPGFARAAMDGFAVRAADASSLPTLRIIGQSLPGRPFAGVVRAGEAVSIATGAPLPTGADAVVMVEKTTVRGEEVTILETVATGRNVGRAGEDVTAGREVLPAGRVLRPQDVGLLAAISCGTVGVVRRPRVVLLATGDELLPPGSTPDGCRIVDSNSPMLAALTARDGSTALEVRYVPDQFEAVRESLANAAANADVVLVSGGTSVGPEDHAPRALAEIGELAVHGVALRPARPVGIGFLPCPVFLLPGNPVSCLCAYDLFASRVIRKLGGRPWELPYRRVSLPLSAAVTSMPGRMDYLRVKLKSDSVEPLGVGGASNLSSAVNADGFVLVPPERDSLATGEMVDVWLYD